MKHPNEPKRTKLYVKIPIIIAVVIAAVVLVMTVFLAAITERTVYRMTKKELRYIAEHNAEEVDSYLNNMLIFSRALSVEVKRYKGLEAETAKYVLLDSLKGVLKDKKIFSAYYAFEPNAYFTNTPEGISYYAYRDGNEIGIDVLRDYVSYGKADYYLPAKETLSTHVTAPYQWELSNGQTVTLITLSTPIIDDEGNFMGVANCDIDVDSLLKLDYRRGDFTKTYQYITTQDGKNIVHSLGKNRFAQIPKEVQKYPDIKRAIQENQFYEAEIKETDMNTGSAFAIFSPINSPGTDVNWTISFVVDKGETQGAVLRILIPMLLISVFGSALLVLISKITIKKALAPVDNVVEMASKMGACELKDQSCNVLKTNDELGMLSDIFADTSRTISSYMEEISCILHNVAKGNLTKRLDSEFKGDFDGIKRDINTIIDSLNETFSQMQRVAMQVAENAENFEYTSREMGKGSVEQAAALQELVANISEITTQVEENAHSVVEISIKTERVGEELNSSNEKMSQLLEAMKAITDTSGKIGNIIHTIEDIAFQTNILALNAAVEAARAGNAGKGFAVVADEVRNLASKSAEAAQNTKDLIQNSLASVSEGAKYANATAESLQTVVNDANSITLTISEISKKTKEQSEALNEASVGITNISNIVQSNAAMAQESAESSRELSEQADMLKGSINEFQLKEA